MTFKVFVGEVFVKEVVASFLLLFVGYNKPVSAQEIEKPIYVPPAYLESIEKLSDVPSLTIKELPVAELKFYAPNTYAPFNCTWGVASWIPIPNTLGDARNWDDNSPGLVDNNPTINSIAQTDKGEWGHVALVLNVDGDRVLIREMNYDFNGSVRERWANINEFKYIHYL